jgi:hypothetical protein
MNLRRWIELDGCVNLPKWDHRSTFERGRMLIDIAACCAVRESRSDEPRASPRPGVVARRCGYQATAAARRAKPNTCDGCSPVNGGSQGCKPSDGVLRVGSSPRVRQPGVRANGRDGATTAEAYERCLGTLAPLRRASESPIAIACLGVLTVFPDSPDFSVPRLRLCIARLTLCAALRPYRRPPRLFATTPPLR